MIIIEDTLRTFEVIGYIAVFIGSAIGAESGDCVQTRLIHLRRNGFGILVTILTTHRKLRHTTLHFEQFTRQHGVKHTQFVALVCPANGRHHPVNQFLGV